MGVRAITDWFASSRGSNCRPPNPLNSLHQMFMTQYTEQWAALDLIAERIRALGHPAPGTYREFARLASIKEVEGVPVADEMVRQLVAAKDQPTADLLTHRLEVHEKTAWMLRSLLEGCPVRRHSQITSAWLRK